MKSYRPNGNIEVEHSNGDTIYYFNDESNRKALSVSKDGKCVFYFNDERNLPCIEYNEEGMKYYAQIMKHKIPRALVTTSGYYKAPPSTIKEALEDKESMLRDYFRFDFHNDSKKLFNELETVVFSNEEANFKKYYNNDKHTIKEEYSKFGLEKYDQDGNLTYSATEIVAREEQEKIEKYFEALPPKGKITTIGEALKYEDTEALNKLIAAGHDINSCDENGNTFLGRYIIETDRSYKLYESEDPLDNNRVYREHLHRVTHMLTKAGALEETEESIKIKEQIRQTEAQKRELNNNKLAKVRKKAAKLADKATEKMGMEKVVQKLTGGKKIEEIELPNRLKEIEKGAWKIVENILSNKKVNS